MEYTATRDKKNPHWNDLLDHVRKLNDQLVALANFYLGNNVKAQLTDDEEMRRATGSIADACLEVVDATCVTVATMRLITAKHNLETKRSAMKAGSDLPLIDNKKKHITQIPGKMNKIERVLTIMEVALSLSKSKNEEEIVHVLEHAMAMMVPMINEETSVKRINDVRQDESGGKNSPNHQQSDQISHNHKENH